MPQGSATFSIGREAQSGGEKGWRWELALKLMNECKFWSTADAISYNATISACSEGKYWECALELLEDRETWTADAISYNAAITACAKGGQQRHAVHLLQTMCTQRIWPDTTSYSTTISACVQGEF